MDNMLITTKVSKNILKFNSPRLLETFLEIQSFLNWNPMMLFNAALSISTSILMLRVDINSENRNPYFAQTQLRVYFWRELILQLRRVDLFLFKFCYVIMLQVILCALPLKKFRHLEKVIPLLFKPLTKKLILKLEKAYLWCSDKTPMMYNGWMQIIWGF